MSEFNASDLTSCDREPIHIPGAIQPYGVMLISDLSGTVVGYANSEQNVLGRAIADLIGLDCTASVSARAGLVALGVVTFEGSLFDAVAYRSENHLVVELTATVRGEALDAAFLADMETIGVSLDQTGSLGDLSQQAARIFQELTGYSRVMIYRFTDDDAGVVLGESINDQSASFMNHHFPASDIPKQARALYVRNKVRVIADVHYTPAPVVSASTDLSSIDMSDSTLRSVSPVHIQYLKNMGVAASASMSIVIDGILWGLVACHHHEPRVLSLTTRLACQTVAAALARQIKTRDENELYRERMRLRAHEDRVIRHLGSNDGLAGFFESSGEELATLMHADGFAAAQGGDIFCAGNCPENLDLRAVAEHVRQPAAIKPFVTSTLSKRMPGAEAYKDVASGLLAVTMSTEVPTILMWFRAEQLQTVKWAGNPHKDVEYSPDVTLAPRVSFEAWSESVSGRSREWTHAETESATRIVKLMLEVRNNRRMRELNRELTTTLRENESLIQQKDYLLKEVNHRVQNSLALVAAFLRMQSRNADAEVKKQLDEAQRRLVSVGLVHRRLYQADSVSVIDLSRYLEELVDELKTTMDADWDRRITVDLTPILISTDKAVRLGLVVNELITNVSKYAYDGQPGPVVVRLEQFRENLRLIVSDRGKGYSGKTEGTGFGSKMLTSLVQSLNGTIQAEDNAPGLRIVMTCPIMDADEARHADAGLDSV
ncbi:GAF domain-containing protein [Aureimonas fodinaquatilis]|uniref:GAF domain-containing protein n=1 Tax=Aureimonas fodinaquatilis TaxID=2565783 RepID=A0A5B0DRP9_9HYPH|nr:histidine kinase dimerization/phosphoacceptor domain -containing protein [Aureimonas fodinaquatilis]KAA0968220.1 GAF domain-containing protein [Aureimonas fodinaquatilis]